MIAAGGKLTAPRPFHDALLESGLPSSTARVLTWLVPAFEVVIGLAVLSLPQPALPLAFAAAAALFLGFTLWLIRLTLRRPGAPCACFGSSSRPVDARTIFRNVAMILTALVAVALTVGPGTSWLQEVSFTGVVFSSSYAAALLCMGAFLTARTHLIISREDFARLQNMGGDR